MMTDFLFFLTILSLHIKHAF